ncbi:ribonucleoside-diphosphate reductase, adenosylcobalamin-dependent [Candidatus Woesearchaeota archaeon RBG_13_36_6]|nr:MAG: ribonucleoside-diphosphate reductase, adenosylcobalamin-dependent [Candidatus Woesearchaeota archaeon RBG_13_36_6]
MKKDILTTLKEPELTDNALFVLKKRYLKDGETTKDLFWRVARNIAQVDMKYKNHVGNTAIEFYNIMASLEFLPNSPTLLNAGRGLQQLSACFVLPIEDSLDSLFTTLKNAVNIQSAGGGTGFNFSRIRPAGDFVGNIPNTAAGPIHYIETYDTALNRIMQGRKRHGANIGILNIDHPNILDFIELKSTDGRLKNFNISVGVTDEFMKRVLEKKNHVLVNPRNKDITKRISAEQLFNKMAENAWKTGDPGIIFLDAIQRANPTPKLADIEATNPCGEQPLLSYESCNLGSINLAKMVKCNKSCTIDWEKLKSTVYTAVHFLDNVIDVNKYPLIEIEKMTLGNRKIGLGVMGFADMLFKLGIAYNSKQGEKTAEKVMKFVSQQAILSSQELAKDRGVFPNFHQSIYKTKRRNATTTTIAPTGSISIIAGCSSGIEPIFSLVTEAMVLFDRDHKGSRMVMINRHFEEELKKQGLFSKELMTEVAEKGGIQHLDLPSKLKEAFVTSHDVSPEWHVKIQAAFQKYTDNAVSKTVNFPNNATVEDVKKVYILAWKLGCKGTTIYRDGSKSEQTLFKGGNNDQKN